MKRDTYVIAGAGLTGLSAAEALRGEGFEGRIVLFGAEPVPPYERPPLSKERLRGEIPADRVLLRNADFYRINAIELEVDQTIDAIDVATREAVAAGGSRITYDQLLIATGVVPRRLRCGGDDLEGIHYLRTLRDCEALRTKLRPGVRALVVGTGFIGCEVAASARAAGGEVVLLGRSLPLAHALGREVGEIYARYHRSHGIELKTGVTVTEFRGSTRVEEAVLSDGTQIACDVVVVGIGVTPTLPAVPGLGLDDGILTDEFCRTNVEGVFAAGDVARSWRPRFGRRLRIEHYENAQLQGTAAGRVMAGKEKAYDPVPFFWSGQFEYELQYYGHAQAWDECCLRGEPADGSFSAFYVVDRRVAAFCAVNRSQDVSAAKRLLGRVVEPRLLADDGVDLRQLATSTAALS